MSIQCTEDRAPAVTSSRRGGKLRVGNGRIVADQDVMQQAASGIINALESLLSATLLFNTCADIVLDDGTSEFVCDDFRETRPGYTFYLDQHNSFSRYNHTLLQLVAETPSLRDGLIDSKNLWKISKVKRYLSHHRRFLGLLFTALHLTSGLPARATEWSTLLLRNTGDRPRSIHVGLSGIYVYHRWSKTTNTLGVRKPTARFMASRVATVFLRYIVLVHPFVVNMASVVYDNQDQNGGGSNPSHRITLQTHLFGAWDGVLSGEHLATSWQTNMEVHGKLPLNIRDYRHVAIVFGREFVSQDVIEGLAEDFVEEAAGHALCAPGAACGLCPGS